MTAILETDLLTKEFGAFTAVNALSLKIPEGSVYGLLGPNGAGKTTTLKMLCGLSRPTSGRIVVAGETLEFGKSTRSNLGYVPDVPSYYKWMKPRELLMFLGKLHHMPEHPLKNRVDELIHKVGLEGYEKKIGTFSRGMKQRLGIAQALITAPKILVLDEPTSALDPIGRSQMLELIRALAGELTVLFSSHNLQDVEQICDRILVMNQGTEIAEDRIIHLKNKFAINKLELQTDSVESLRRAASLLTGTPGVMGIELLENSNSMNIGVTELRQAQINIPLLLSTEGIPLSSFRVIEPTLEQLFLKMVTGNER